MQIRFDLQICYQSDIYFNLTYVYKLKYVISCHIGHSYRYLAVSFLVCTWISTVECSTY